MKWDAEGYLRKVPVGRGVQVSQVTQWTSDSGNWGVNCKRREIINTVKYEHRVAMRYRQKEEKNLKVQRKRQDVHIKKKKKQAPGTAAIRR